MASSNHAIRTGSSAQGAPPQPIQWRWPYVIGIAVVLASEFVPCDVLLAAQATDVHIWATIAAEWLIAVVLGVAWVPRVEGESLESVGYGRFRGRHLWLGAAAYAPASVVMTGGGSALESVGLDSMRALQSAVRRYGLATRLGPFLTH